MQANRHWIKHLIGAPSTVTLHHYEDEEGTPMSAIYDGDTMLSTIERCGENMMITHFRRYHGNRNIQDDKG